LNSLSSKIEEVTDQLSGYFSRANDLFYDPPTENVALDKSCNWNGKGDANDRQLMGSKFTFSAMAHSGVGRLVGFDVDLAAGTVNVDQIGQHEISHMLGLPPLNVHVDEENEDEGVNNECNFSQESPLPIHPSPLDLEYETVDSDAGSELEWKTSDDDSDAGSKLEWETSDDDSDAGSELEWETSDDDSDESDGESEPQSQSPETRAYGTPDDSDYKSENTFTCVETSKTSYVNIVRRPQRNKKHQKRMVFPLASQSVEQVDLIATATRMASTFISTGVVDIRDGSTESPLYKNAIDFSLKDEYLPCQGFARRDYNEDVYGNQYLEEFKPIIQELYQRGEKDSSNKMQPDQMHDHIRKRNPFRFSIPSSTTIQQYSSSLTHAKKKKPTDAKRNTRNAIPLEITTEIEKLLQGNLQKKPLQVVKELRENLLGTEKEHMLPTNKVLSSKIGSMKSQMKKSAKRSVL
jgi:hypothetical protein